MQNPFSFSRKEEYSYSNINGKKTEKDLIETQQGNNPRDIQLLERKGRGPPRRIHMKLPAKKTSMALPFTPDFYDPLHLMRPARSVTIQSPSSSSSSSFHPLAAYDSETEPPAIRKRKKPRRTGRRRYPAKRRTRRK